MSSQPLGERSDYQRGRLEAKDLLPDPVAQFRRFVDATKSVTEAERRGGGDIYEAGWTRKAGWSWSSRTPRMVCARV